VLLSSWREFSQSSEEVDGVPRGRRATDADRRSGRP
jgi:hypothetical protein